MFKNENVSHRNNFFYSMTFEIKKVLSSIIGAISKVLDSRILKSTSTLTQ